MAVYSSFAFHFVICYFMFLLLAAAHDECESEPYSCGYLGYIRFPFTPKPDCGGIHIRNCEDKIAVKEIQLTNQSWYKVDSIFIEYYHASIFIHYPDLDTVSAPDPLEKVFKIGSNITFFSCLKNSKDVPESSMIIYKSCPYSDIYFSSSKLSLPMPGLPFACLLTNFLSLSMVPIPTSSSSCTFLFSFVQIDVNFTTCKRCPGKCRLEPDKSHFTCPNEAYPPGPYPHPQPLPLPTPKTKTNRWKSKTLIIGLSLGSAIATAVALFVILLLSKRRNKYSDVQRSTNSGSFRNATTQESGAVYFGIPVFSYEELQEATNNFDHARELGEGGFGTVYYGKLRDGREVAVKRLFERNYRPVETFINEVQILTRLRHRNLVSLYGCTSRHSRELLLVYEYIPNGTVSYHLHGDQAKPGSLPWPVRMKIAIETASALTYLHNSDIIHRDVKTSNILLDNNFGVKVADFGLSRLFPDDVTHVSTAPRGTPGYVDPDYRLCYQLTTKSDVYSFGVVLVELISSLPAVDVNRNRDDIKLSNLAIRKIQKGAFCELVDPSLGFRSDDRLKKMIISVAKLAFQCLQGDKEFRPSMAQVLEMLQIIESGGDVPENLEGIEVPGARASQSYEHPPLPNTLMKPQRLHQTS